jgi:prepilin peptidase CpaA
MTSVYTDLKYGKIYNKMTFPCITAGLMLGGISAGLDGFVFSLKGLIIASLSVLLFLAYQLIGGGDAKLILAVGALMGPNFALYTLLYTALAGGGVAMLALARRRILGATLHRFGEGALYAAVYRTPVVLLSGPRAGHIPYSIAIATGVALAMATGHAQAIL